MNGGVNSPDAAQAPSDYFRFSIVRNPYDRFISGWRYCQERGSPYRSILDTLLDMPQLPESEDLYASPLPSFQAFEYAHLTRCQHEILYLPNGTLGVDFLMRFEIIQRDFDTACAFMGISKRTLPRANSSDRLSYRQYFDADLQARKLLEKRFEKDFQLFGYSY